MSDLGLSGGCRGQTGQSPLSLAFHHTSQHNQIKELPEKGTERSAPELEWNTLPEYRQFPRHPPTRGCRSSVSEEFGVFWFSVKVRARAAQRGGFRPSGGDFQGMGVFRSDRWRTTWSSASENAPPA